MPQAIERLLATPMISPRLPRIRPEASAIRSPLSRRPTGRLLWHRGLCPCKKRRVLGILRRSAVLLGQGAAPGGMVLDPDDV